MTTLVRIGDQFGGRLRRMASVSMSVPMATVWTAYLRSPSARSSLSSRFASAAMTLMQAHDRAVSP